MAHTGLTNLFLFLALVISTILGINGADPQCEMNGGNSTSDYTLTVSPETLSNNTNYTVTLTGSGNVTVILQALNSSGPVGNWSNGNLSCNGSPLFENPFEQRSSFQAQWTSPENVSPVNITAYIHNENGTFMVSKTLSKDTVTPTATTNHTTMAPSSSNSTAHTATSNTATIATKTTSASSAVQTSLLSVALFQILGLLIITSK